MSPRKNSSQDWEAMSGNEPTWNDKNDENDGLPSFDEGGHDDLYDSPSGSSDMAGPLYEPDPLDPPEELDDTLELTLSDDDDPYASYARDAEPELDLAADLGLESEPEPEPVVAAGPDEPTGLDESAGFDASAAPTKNRPAEGARQASPDDVLSSEFIGSEGASDFLGLDLEFEAEADAAGGLELQEAPYAGTAVAEDEEDSLFAAPEAGPMDAEGDDYGDLVDDELGELAEEEPEERKPKILLLAGGAFFLGLAAVLVVLLVPRFLGGDGGTGGPDSSTTVATRPQPPTPTPTVDPTPVNDAPRFGAGFPYDPRFSLPVVLALAENAPDMPPKPPPIEDFVTGDPNAGDIVGPVTDAADPVAPPTPGAEGGGAGTELVYDRDQRVTELTFEDLILEASNNEAFLSRSLAQLDMVWRGDTVPMDAIASPAIVMMPSVGSVRTHLHSGEIIEGRLFALGQHKVWLDMELGRIGLDGRSVERIERLPEEGEGTQLDPDELATGRRVRARVPGGVIYGRVRSVKGTTVTLVTDSGGRITLDDPYLEPVSDRKSVVLKF